MEKRRVRLYKAQEGGQPSADMLGYPGAQQAQAPQMNEEQLVQAITQDISNDLPKEAIVAKLVTVMGVDMMQANQYVEAVYTMLQNQMEEPDEDEEADPNQIQQQVVEEQIAKPMTKLVMHNDLVQGDEDGDLTDLEDENMARYGGMPRAAEGLETGWGNRYEIQFPELQAYLPYNMEEQFSNPAAAIAWQAPEEIVSEEEVIDYTQPVVDPSNFRMGGYKTKKGYVNSVLKLVKKQLGGDQEVESNDADPRGDDLRKSHLNAFISSIKKEGNMSLAKQQAEEQYDQMMSMHQQQMGQPDLSAFIPQNEMGMDQAQYGGMPREQRRAVRQLQKTLKRLPVGNVGSVSKFDVHREGLFGNPREYTIEFDKPLVQLASNPMLAANYGYGFGTKVTRTPARVKTEYIKNVVNSEALKEVAKETGSEAADKATVNTDTPSTAANPVAPASTPAAATTPVATVPAAPVTRPPVAPVVTAPVAPVTPVAPVIPPVVPRITPPPVEGVDVAPGVTNIQQQVSNYVKPVNQRVEGVDLAPGVTNIQQRTANYVKPVVPPTMAELTKRAAANPTSVQDIKLPGDDTLYWKRSEGDDGWAIDDWTKDGPEAKYPAVTNKEVLKKLNAGKGKGAEYFTLQDKPGYIYRKRADGAFVKLKENANGTISNKPTDVIKPGDKNYKYLSIHSLNVKYEVGGSVDNPFVNAYGDLQKFMGGGDDISIPELTQGDIDYVYSKDTTDPYMPEAQRGGAAKELTQRYLPANMPRRQYQSQMVKGPYDRASGSALASIPGYNPNAVVKDIKVTKEGLFGKPRRYTVTYNNNPTGNPDDRKLAARPITVAQTTPQAGTTTENKGEDKSAKQTALENAGYGQKTDVTGLKAKSKRAIRQGERQRDRDLEKLYEEDPTSVEFDPMNLDAPADRTASNNSAYSVPGLVDTTTEEDFATWGTPQEAMEQINAYRFPEGESDDSGWGTAGVPMTQFNAYSFPESAEDDAAWGMPQDMVVNPFQQASEQVVTEDVSSPVIGGMTSDFGPMSMEGPLATEEDQLTPEENAAARAQFAQEYMGDSTPYDPNTSLVTPGMIDYNFIQNPEAAYNARLQELAPPTDMGAWSAMDYPAELIQPGVNPFDLPIEGGEDYYSPFAQPVPKPVAAPRSNAGTSTRPKVAPIDRAKPLTTAQKQQLAAQEARAVERQQRDDQGNQENFENLPPAVRQQQVAAHNKNERKIAAYKLYYDQPLQKLNTRLELSYNKLDKMNLSSAEKKEKRQIILDQYYAELKKLEKSWDQKSKTVKQFGGEALNKFIPQALLGTETPVSMENNPTAPNVDIDKDFKLPTVSSKAAGQQLFEQSRKNIQAQANYQPDEYTVDYKSKSRVNDTQGALNSFNAAARGATGIIDRLAGRKQEAEMYDNLNADNLYASDPSRDRGDYDTNTGLYRPDEQGQSWNSRSAQYGGSIYEEGGYVEGQEVYMTDDELDEFLANGGEVEYI